MQHQQAQPLTPQSLIAARSSMLYAQSPMSALQQQQQAALHSQLGMSSGASSGGFNVLRGETSVGGNGALNAGVFPDFGHNAGAGKQDMGNAVSTDSRGGNSTGQNGDGTEPLYLKSSEEEGN